MKHPIPRWTFIITPIVLLVMLSAPWIEINAAHPEAAPLALALIAIGNAFVLISITHWIKSVIGGAK